MKRRLLSALGIAASGAASAPRRLRVDTRVKVETTSFRSVGTIIEIGKEFERGFGTKLHPTCLIEFDDGSAEWFNGVALAPMPSKAS